MLEQVAINGSHNIVSWQPHGKAFRVHQPEVFARTIMPRYFKQTKYKSFQRQLHIYGFHRINKGLDKGAYFHDLFIQNNKSTSLRMVREKIKGTASKDHAGQEIELPNFYKKMGIMEEHPPYYNYNEIHRNFTTPPKPLQPLLSMADFSGVAANNTYSSSTSGVGGRRDSWLEMAEQKAQFFADSNIASVVVKEDIEDGDEVFFEGKKFHFVPAPAMEAFLAPVSAQGPIAYMPKCA
jgi:hypothetical protein